MSTISNAVDTRFQANGRNRRPLAFAIALLALQLVVLSSAYAYGQSNAAYQRVRVILDSQQNAQSILQFVHFGADYHGHTFVREAAALDGHGNIVVGERAVIYRYKWEDDGVTDIAFFYDSRGVVVGSYIVSTNAVLNQPFVLANLSIQVVGRFVINSDDKMSPADRRLALGLIDRADAHGLLDFWLRML